MISTSSARDYLISLMHRYRGISTDQLINFRYRQVKQLSNTNSKLNEATLLSILSDYHDLTYEINRRLKGEIGE